MTLHLAVAHDVACVIHTSEPVSRHFTVLRIRDAAASVTATPFSPPDAVSSESYEETDQEASGSDVALAEASSTQDGTDQAQRFTKLLVRAAVNVTARAAESRKAKQEASGDSLSSASRTSNNVSLNAKIAGSNGSICDWVNDTDVINR